MGQLVLAAGRWTPEGIWLTEAHNLVKEIGGFMSDEQKAAREVKNLKKLDIGLLAVFVLGISIIAALYFGTPSQDETAPSVVVPEPPLVTLPPELVIKLLSIGISEIALIGQENNDIKQVLSLRPDGTCEACLQKLLSPKLPYQEGGTGSQGHGLFDLLVSPATAKTGAACPHDCLCSSGHCKNTLGSCCKCT